MNFLARPRKDDLVQLVNVLNRHRVNLLLVPLHRLRRSVFSFYYSAQTEEHCVEDDAVAQSLTRDNRFRLRPNPFGHEVA